ncbi:MAG TPA: hypothetical protein VHR72_07500 [Gemmataceae bacterium]|jgi:hypothetical protein|nr:hypothetical protein [Gemmataceae bacterium]
MTIEQYTLEKPVWTDADYEQMGWHDAHVHAMAFRPELFEFWLDLDYIFQWVHPEGDEKYFRFWVAPVTLVFTNVRDLAFDIESYDGGLSVQSFGRSEPTKPRNADYIPQQTEWFWRLECNEGEITLRSVGYSQFTRHPPVLLQAQQLTFEDRGGISFNRDYAG